MIAHTSLIGWSQALAQFFHNALGGRIARLKLSLCLCNFVVIVVLCILVGAFVVLDGEDLVPGLIPVHGILAIGESDGLDPKAWWRF